MKQWPVGQQPWHCPPLCSDLDVLVLELMFIAFLAEPVWIMIRWLRQQLRGR